LGPILRLDEAAAALGLSPEVLQALRDAELLPAPIGCDLYDRDLYDGEAVQIWVYEQLRTPHRHTTHA
jgi:hypothetical protein